MNIVHVPRRFTRDEWGGTETVVLETSKHLRALGHDARVICPQALSPLRRELVDGVPVERVSYFYPYLGLRPEARRQLDKKGGNLFSFEMMRVLERMQAPDVLHLHTGKRLGGIVRRVARSRRIPYVLQLHGGLLDVPADEVKTWTAPTRGTLEWGRALGWWVGARRVETDAAAIITLGETERARVQAAFPHVPVHRLPNGVDTDRFAHGDGARFRAHLRLPAQTRLLLTVGRIDPQKNQKTAVEALARVRAEGHDVHLCLVGPVTSAAYRDEVERRVHELGLLGRVTICSQIDSQLLVDAFHAADAFLLPSVHEPFGIVVLEAWSAGCPVVASRVGGIPTFVEDGRDGLLVEPHDVEQMARGLCTLLKMPQWARMIGLRGRDKARAEYGWAQVTRRLLQIYEEARHRAHTLRA